MCWCDNSCTVLHGACEHGVSIELVVPVDPTATLAAPGHQHDRAPTTQQRALYPWGRWGALTEPAPDLPFYLFVFYFSAIAYGDTKNGTMKGGILLETVTDVRPTTVAESRKPNSFIICTQTNRGTAPAPRPPVQRVRMDVVLVCGCVGVRRVCVCGAARACPS
jgi:hypothetical protein